MTAVGGDSHILILRDDGWIQQERLNGTELSEWFFEEFDNALGKVYLAFADTSLTEREFEPHLDEFIATVKSLRSQLFEQAATTVLRQALSDPEFKDPIKRLPNATRRLFDNTAAKYYYDENAQGGASG